MNIEKLKSYVELMRLDKPIGTFLLLWPTLWALWIASSGQVSWQWILLFCLGVFFMRSAGCVMNDFADRDFDGQVTRTQNRPLVLGKVGHKETIILFIVLCLFAFLCLFSMNYFTWVMSIPALVLAIIYPFTKRFFPIPQFILGLAFSFGILMAFTALTNHLPLVSWLLFFSNIFWILAYDTIYAISDKTDDIKLPIKSSAKTLGNYDICAVIISHLLFTLGMVFVGLKIDAGIYYWSACILVLILQIWQFFKIQERNRDTCFSIFLRNNDIGLIWFVGIFLNYY